MITLLSAPRRCAWRQAWGALAAIGLLAGLAAGCGKKGPPLAPLVRLPAAVDGFSARRLGSTVYLRFTVPSKNQDNSTPADISEVRVYGFTGTPASDEDMVKYGTLVASVPIRRPPSPEEEDRARGGRGRQPTEQAPRTPKKPVEPEPGFDQGASVTVTEAWTEALARPVTVPAKREKKPPLAETAVAPRLLPVASFADALSRVYVAVSVNRRGHRGAFSRHEAVPVMNVPAPPDTLKLAHNETAITLEWSASPDAPPANTASPDVPSLPVTRLPLLAGPAWSYDVFDVTAEKARLGEGTRESSGSRATAVPGAPGAGVPPRMPQPEPVPLNERPLTTTKFSDSRIEFGTERCYVVRTVKAFGGLQEESEPSEMACITPRDVFPPAPPKGLTAVASDGVVSLIWDANGEKDLDGYFVLRGDAPDGTLQPLTREPIHETTFNDTTVKPGVRYTYAVVALDKAGNRSGESNKVEQTAR